MKKEEKLLPNKSFMPLCVRNAVLLEKSSIRVVRLIPNRQLQSNRVIADQPSKPTSRIFSFQF
jgi:hypothetical protein